jgi:hypothetical protein
MMLSTDQRLLLLAAPAFDLSFRGDRIGQTLKLLRKDQLHRAARDGVSGVFTVVVLRGAALQVCAGNTDVIRPVGAKQDIEKGAQVTDFDWS